MTLAEYSRQALSTWAVDPVAEPERARTHAALMLVAEAGEVAGLYQKEAGQSHPLDPARVIDELGDVLWAMAALFAAYGQAWDDELEDVPHCSFPTRTHDAPHVVALDLAYFAAELARDMDADTRTMGGESDWPLLWDVGYIAAHYGATIGDVMERNLSKLAARYPNGFTPAASIHRTA